MRGLGRDQDEVLPQVRRGGRVRLAVVAVASVVALSGCGGGDGPTAPTSTPTPTAVSKNSSGSAPTKGAASSTSSVPPKATQANTKAGASAPRGGQGDKASMCGLKGHETSGTLTKAPQAEWVLVGTTAAPRVEGAGPGMIEDDGFGQVPGSGVALRVPSSWG